MNIEKWLYNRAKFSHGGTLHQQADINDMMVFMPHIKPDISVVYERPFQKFWLKLYNLYTK